MKYLTTKLSVQHLSITDFINIIQNLYQLDKIALVPYIVSFDGGKLYWYDQTVAFQISQNQNYYEYILNEKDQELYISLDINNDQYVNLISYLIDHHYLKAKQFLYDQVKMGNKNNIEDIISFIENETLLPVVYLQHRFHGDIKKLMHSLKTMANVLSSEDEEFDQAFQKHFHLRNNSYIIYLNHEFQKISISKNEHFANFITKVQIKIQNYITQRSYPFPYDMKLFQHFIIEKYIEYNNKNNDTKVLDIENKLLILENKKKNIEDDINDMAQKIDFLNNQNEEFINQQKTIPLIIKEDEKEFYEREQKDLLLSLLKDEFDQHNNPMIKDILDQNPPVGNKDEYLNHIFNLLVSNGLSKKAMDLLHHYGIYVDLSRKHPAGTFFNNSRYTITFSSTPGDVNAGRKSYRQIKNSFF